MKKLGSYFLVIVLVLNLSLSPVFAGNQPQNVILTLDEFKELALENSRTIKTLEQTIREVEYNTYITYNSYESAKYGGYHNSLYQQTQLAQLIASKEAELAQLEEGTNEYIELKNEVAILQMQAMQNKTAIGSSLSASKQTKKAWEEAEEALDDTKRAFEDFKKQLGYTIENLYTGTLKLQNQINALEMKYQQLMKLLNIERVKMDLGMTSDVAVDKLAVQTSDLGKTIKELKTTLKINKWRINDMIGRELDSKLQLVGFQVEYPIPVGNAEPVIEKALENIASIPQKEDDIEDMKDELEDLDGSNEKEVKRAEIKKAELALEDTKQNIRTTVKNLVADLDAKAKAYQLAEISLKTAQKTYEWDKKKFELGMISEIQMQASELAYQEALNNKVAAGYDYFLAKHAVELAEQGVLVGSSSTSDSSTASSTS